MKNVSARSFIMMDMDNNLMRRRVVTGEEVWHLCSVGSM